MLRIALSILWPSFLVAIIAEGCFFTLFDPRELLRLVSSYDMPPIAVHTFGFFYFWIFCSAASTLTYYLVNSPKDRPPT
jgi:hypothetical protein